MKYGDEGLEGVSNQTAQFFRLLCFSAMPCSHLGSCILVDNDFEVKPFKQFGQVAFVECRAMSVVQLFTSLSGHPKVHVVDNQDDASRYTMNWIHLWKEIKRSLDLLRS